MPSPGAERDTGRLVAAVALAIALAVLTWRATLVLAGAFSAVSFPISLDYGEGIVLQQAILMTGPRAFGPITVAPYIVFHYPPVYHLAVRAAAALAGGADLLETARVVSLLAALGAAAAVAALAAYIAPAGRWRWAAAGTAALAFLGASPVAAWLPLARVDMVALACTMGGLALVACASRSRAALVGAAVLFVLGVFAKQTSLAAPVAAVAVLFACDRRRALGLVATGLAASLGLLAAAQWVTDGGFLRHVVTYNVNRFEALRLLGLVLPILMHLPMLLAIAFGLMAGRDGSGGSARLQDDPRRRALAMLLVYFGLSSAMLLLFGKSGSAINYLLEWVCSAAALVGVAVGRAAASLDDPMIAFPARRTGVVAMATALAVQPLLLPPPLSMEASGALRATVPGVAESLVDTIRTAGRPVISDDMVAVLRAGQEVAWEPAIFAELASLGRWDEAPFVAAIRGGDYAFAVTDGMRGDRLFHSRYNTAVADAMDVAWPRKARLGWLVLHLPADASLPPGATLLRDLH